MTKLKFYTEYLDWYMYIENIYQGYCANCVWLCLVKLVRNVLLVLDEVMKQISCSTCLANNDYITVMLKILQASIIAANWMLCMFILYAMVLSLFHLSFMCMSNDYESTKLYALNLATIMLK